MNSLLYHHRCVLNTILMVGAQRRITCLGAFGAESQKRLELYVTHPVYESIIRAGQESRKRALETGCPLKPLTTKRGRWVTGKKKAMAESAAYPDEFCKAIVTMTAGNLPHDEVAH